MIIDGKEVKTFLDEDYEECKVIEGLAPNMVDMLQHTGGCPACMRNVLRNVQKILSTLPPPWPLTNISIEGVNTLTEKPGKPEKPN